MVDQFDRTVRIPALGVESLESFAENDRLAGILGDANDSFARNLQEFTAERVFKLNLLIRDGPQSSRDAFRSPQEDPERRAARVPGERDG